MASAALGLAPGTAPRALATLPSATVLHHGAGALCCSVTRRAPARSPAAYGGGCSSPRVAAAPSWSSGDGASAPNSSPAATAATTSTSVSTAMTVDLTVTGSTSGLPWKVQWQVQGYSTDVVAWGDGDSDLGPGFGSDTSGNGSSGGSSASTKPFSSLQQQQQLQPSELSSSSSSSPSFSQLTWTPFDRNASIKRAALEASGWDAEAFNARFSDLAAVLPDLPRALPSLSPSQLVAAMSDPHALAIKVLVLKAALPSTNVGMLLLMHPPFLDPACGPDRLIAGVEHAARVLGGMAVAEEVLQWYPPLLDPTVLDASIAQLRRLVPHLARNCLPGVGSRGAAGGMQGGGDVGAAGGGWSAGSSARAGDARQLVHLLGIVMQTEGGGARCAEGGSGDGAGSMWWGCS